MRDHKYRPRGVSPELRELLDNFYMTPAGKKLANKAKAANIQADVQKAQTVLKRLLDRQIKNPVTTITTTAIEIDV